MAFLPRSTYRVDVVDGGMNTENQSVTSPPNTALYVAGTTDDVGGIALATGFKTFCSNLSTAVDSLDGKYVGGTEYLLVMQGGVLRQATASASTFSMVSGSTGVFTAGVNVCVRSVEGQAYFTNGYASPHRYDGTNFFTVGVSAYTFGIMESMATGVANSSAGSLTSGGQYLYAISGANTSAVESNYVVMTPTITVANGGQVALSGIPNFPSSAGVNTKYLYRNTAGASSTFYRVTALTSAQTTCTDVAADSALVTAGETDHFPPPHCKFFWYHRGRMFAAGDPSYTERVYWSESGHPEIWPALNSMDIGKGDGQPITGIAIMGNSLVVHKSNATMDNKSIWLVYMPDSVDATDSTNWYVVKSPSQYAASSNRSITFFDNKMAFLDKRGVYAFNGESIATGPATSRIGEYMADSLSANIESTIDDFSPKSTATMLAFDNKLYLLGSFDLKWMNRLDFSYAYLLEYTYGVSSVRGGQGAWACRPAPDANAMTIFNGKLVAASQGTPYGVGQIVRFGDDYSLPTGTNAITYVSNRIGGNKAHWGMKKIWRFLYVNATNSSGGSIGVSVTWDDQSGVGQNISYTFPSTVTGETTLKIPLTQSTSAPIVSRWIQLKIDLYVGSSVSLDEVVKFHGYSLEYLLRSERISSVPVA